MKVGDRVRVQRDEVNHPPRGSWKQWKGKVGSIVEVNRSGKNRVPEFGVSFRPLRQRPDTSLHGDDAPVWFLGHELVPAGSRKTRALGPESHADGLSAVR